MVEASTILIAGAILAVLGFMWTKNKWNFLNMKKKMAGTVGVIAIILGALYILPAVGLFGDTFDKYLPGLPFDGDPIDIGFGPAAAGITTVDGVPQLNVCGGDVSPGLDINTFDIHNPGTALAENSLYRKVGNTAWTGFTSGTEITALEVGATYEVALGVAAASHDDDMFGPIFETTIPCKTDITMDVGVYDDDVETALTASYWNNDDAATTATTFGSGDVRKMSWRFEATNENVFGNPFIESSGLGDNGVHRVAYPNVICADLNSTAWDAPQSVKYDGVEMRRLPTPSRHSAVAAEIAYCYEFPVVTDTMERVYITMDAKAVDPTNDDTLLLYAASYYLDLDDGEVKWGVEDEAGNAVGTGAADSVTVNIT